MWRLHQTCQNYSQRPSAVFGIRDNWLAWDFDHAVSALGLAVENRLKETDKDGKHKYRSLEKALNLPVKPKPISRTLLQMHGVKQG